MDPSTGPMWLPISTNQRCEMLLFLAQIFVSHTGITNNSSAHTDSAWFCCFWFNHPTAKWLYGCLQVIHLEQFPVRISMDKEQFPVRISMDKAPTPLTKIGICSFFFFFFCHSPFFLSLYRHVRFMTFQSVLVGTTPAFTIIINSRPIYRYSLIRSHCALQHSPMFSTLTEKNIHNTQEK